MQPNHYIGDAGARTGFGGLEAIDDVTMLCVPDLMTAYQAGVIDGDAVKAVQLAMNDSHPAAIGGDAATTRHYIADNSAAGSAPVTVDWFIDLEAAASPAIAPIIHQLAARPAVRRYRRARRIGR